MGIVYIKILTQCVPLNIFQVLPPKFLMQMCLRELPLLYLNVIPKFTVTPAGRVCVGCHHL